MIYKKIFTLVVLVFIALMILPLATDVKPFTSLSSLAEKYVKDGPTEVGAANLVTAIVVTYRGFDTLGEVAVLFIATAGVGFLLTRRENENKEEEVAKKRDSSEILKTGADFLLPLIFLFGVYIFVHGHLTPGGGFQGGVVIASAVLLILLTEVNPHLNEKVLHYIESLSGFLVVLLGVAGIFYASGFLDNRIILLGEFGKLFSAGIIPILYSLIGLKVGTELTGILENMSQE